MIYIGEKTQDKLKELCDKTDFSPEYVIWCALLEYEKTLKKDGVPRPPLAPIDWSFLNPLIEGIQSFGTLFKGDDDDSQEGRDDSIDAPY